MDISDCLRIDRIIIIEILLVLTTASARSTRTIKAIQFFVICLIIIGAHACLTGFWCGGPQESTVGPTLVRARRGVSPIDCIHGLQSDIMYRNLQRYLGRSRFIAGIAALAHRFEFLFQRRSKVVDFAFVVIHNPMFPTDVRVRRADFHVFRFERTQTTAKQPVRLSNVPPYVTGSPSYKRGKHLAVPIIMTIASRKIMGLRCSHKWHCKIRSNLVWQAHSGCVSHLDNYDGVIRRSWSHEF